jgi:hypothetical protein
VAAGDRTKVRQLLDAVRVGDANRVGELSEDLAGAGGMTRVAVIAAGFDKDDPEATVERLEAIAAGGGEVSAVRDRARLLATIAELWGGGERAASCSALAVSAGSGTDGATRRLALPIEAELCD